MNIEEAGAVLAKAAGYDNRTIGEANIRAWHEALADIDLADALDAVAIHHRESTDWLMPAHIRRIVAHTTRERRRYARELAGQQAAERDAITRSPVRDRSADVAALVADLRDKLPDTGADVLRRPEWVEADRRRTRATTNPNPHYTGPPPPGGWPVPGDAPASPDAPEASGERTGAS